MTGQVVKRLHSRKKDPLLGEQLGDYEIVGVIGHGGMGQVYKGYDGNLDRFAAVKVFDSEGAIADDQDEYRQRFQREARAIARLRHPNIVGVYQFGQVDKLYYMAMVLIEGRDLREILRAQASQGRYLDYQAIMRIMTDVAQALDYAHSQGVIHRDVKPSNIMVTADGHAVLTDFGLALSLHEGTLGDTFGSVHYIAPEQALNSADAVPQSDLYSLGIVLYEVLTGHLPFDDPTAMTVALHHINDPPPMPHLFKPDLSAEIEAVVLRLLEKDPARRYPSGDALLVALEKALGVIDVDDDTRDLIAQTTLPDPPAEPTTPFIETQPDPELALSTTHAPAQGRRSIGKYALIMLLILAVVSIVIVLASQPEPTQEATALPTAAAVLPTAVPVQPTSAPTEAPAAIVDPQVRLVYDSESLVLLNQSKAPVDLSGISFVQPVADGPDLDFPARQWSGGSAPISALPPGDCFQVWTTQIVQLEVPGICGLRHKWEQASFPHWFWISDTPDATFELRRGSEVLAECVINAGECLVTP